MFWLMLAFWLLLNGRITAEILILGVLICGAIYLWCCKAMHYNWRRELQLAKKAPGAVLYLVLLVKEVIVAALQVMALVLSPRAKEVEPRLVYFKSPVDSDIGKVILSNSITLTPGTITCGVGEHGFCVHALDASFAGGMDDSDFVHAIKKLED